MKSFANIFMSWLLGSITLTAPPAGADPTFQTPSAKFPLSAFEVQQAIGPYSIQDISSLWTPATTVPPDILLNQISMASRDVGYAVGELGKVIKTEDGGVTWDYVLDQGYPFYYYGVEALNEQTVVISGFDNSRLMGLIRWSDDGGDTWGTPVILSGPSSFEWLGQMEFATDLDGVIASLGRGAVFRTTNGGRTAEDWTYQIVTSNWFGSQFTFLSDQRLWLSGIENWFSWDGGESFLPLASSPEVFDGAIAMLPSNRGYVGGGTISPTDAGWLYQTFDGGRSLSAEAVLNTPYPIRAIGVLDQKRAWAVGGNYFSGVGGIWGTEDAGETWTLELDTPNELKDFEVTRFNTVFVDLYVVGPGSQIWRRRVYSPIVFPACVWDLNGDRRVGIVDLRLLVELLGTDPQGPPDFNADGIVDVIDARLLIRRIGDTCQ